MSHIPSSIPLWPKNVPGALGELPEDIPTLTAYLPRNIQTPCAAFVICPGGAYGGLAEHEGEGYAKWLNQHGIAGLVLKYRLGSRGYRHPVMLNDAARAVRIARAWSSQWQIDPNRIGVIGSSAGGHLAATLLTQFARCPKIAGDGVDEQSARPDLGVLCYSVVSMGEHTHEDSRRNLLGDGPSPELIEELSAESQVSAKTPPCFIWHTWEDGAVKAENSMDFATALRKAGVRFELHIYEQGGHGIGLGGEPLPHRWTQDCTAWLGEHNFISESQ